MKKEILNVEKNDRREYVSLSVKVVDIHLSDCINTSPITVEEGWSDNDNYYESSFANWPSSKN